MANMVNLTIDGIEVEVPQGSTVLEAAEKVGIYIPTLCHMNMPKIGMVNQPASCRICVVEVVGKKNLAPACATPVTKNMVVRTNTRRVLDARRTIMELLLSDHPKDCLTCSQSGDCELQSMAERLGIRRINITGTSISTVPMDASSPSLIRDLSKCIMCRRCETACNTIQSVGALSAVNRGFNAYVGTSLEAPLDQTSCVNCGQCVQVCPVGALTPKDHIWEVIGALNDPSKTVVVQTAPSVRAALGEEFGVPVGTSVTGRMASALRKIGFDYVYDTDFGADLTIVEEANELVGRITKYLNGEPVSLPMFTSCCPAWIRFIETQYPEYLDLPSSCRSPQEMFSAVAKAYLPEKLGIRREDLVIVSVMPCLAKKYEIGREEFKEADGSQQTDISITTRELAQLIKQMNIDLMDMEEGDFDDPLGESSGAGVIFGKTGGVMEAALRTAYEQLTGETLEKVEFEDVRSAAYGIRTAHVTINGVTLNIAISSGLANARAIMEEIKAGNPNNYHAIEIMACPGGCVNGGGQPYHHGREEVIFARQQSLLQEDAGKPVRKSHENPSIKKIYAEFLGTPGSERAHHLLHTTFSAKETV